MSLLLLGAGPSSAQTEPVNLITNGTFVNGDQDWQFVNEFGWEIVTGDPGYAKFNAATSGTYYLFQPGTVELGDYKMTCKGWIDEGEVDGFMLFNAGNGGADVQFNINTTEPTTYETTITYDESNIGTGEKNIRWRGVFANQPWYITDLSYVRIG